MNNYSGRDIYFHNLSGFDLNFFFKLFVESNYFNTNNQKTNVEVVFNSNDQVVFVDFMLIDKNNNKIKNKITFKSINSYE